MYAMYASVAEMEYALRLGRSSLTGLEVQILSEAQNNCLFCARI